MTAATFLRLAPALLLAACGSSKPAKPAPSPEPPSATAPAAGEPAATDLVSAELVADVTRVAPGQELALGVRATMAEGWHIYWINPGDSGLATELSVTAPAGFQVGAPRFPGPERFDLPGDIVNYGYAGEVLLSVPVIAPDQLGAGPQRFAAELSFLACREACLPGKHRLSLELAAADAEAPSEPANAELFARYRARLPVPLEGADSEWREEGGVRTVILSFAGAESVDYFPARDEPLIGMATMSGDATQLYLSYSAEPSERGVIAVTRAGQTRYFENDLPWEDSP